MKNKITAIVKNPYRQAEVVEIDNNLEELQKIVGGYIEAVYLPNVRNVIGFVNDEGLLIGLEPNIYRPEYKDAFVGPIVFVGNGKNGDSVSLTDERIKKITNYLKANSVKNFTEFLINIETDFAHYKQNMQTEM